MSDELIRAKSGVDAVEYLNFQKHMIVYTAVICALSLGVILPVNYSGDNGKVEHYDYYQCSDARHSNSWT